MTEREKAALLRAWLEAHGGGAVPFRIEEAIWQPFNNIAQAKEVQTAMLDHGYCTGTDARPGGGWFAYFERGQAEGGTGLARPTEAAAICEASGQEMKLWEEAD